MIFWCIPGWQSTVRYNATAQCNMIRSNSFIVISSASESNTSNIIYNCEVSDLLHINRTTTFNQCIMIFPHFFFKRVSKDYWDLYVIRLCCVVRDISYSWITNILYQFLLLCLSVVSLCIHCALFPGQHRSNLYFYDWQTLTGSVHRRTTIQGTQTAVAINCKPSYKPKHL